MADVYQTRAQLVSDFGDNTSGAITAQLLRDFLYSTIILNSAGLVDVGAATVFKLPCNLDLNTHGILNGGSATFATNLTVGAVTSLDNGAIVTDGNGNLDFTPGGGDVIGAVLSDCSYASNKEFLIQIGGNCEFQGQQIVAAGSSQTDVLTPILNRCRSLVSAASGTNGCIIPSIINEDDLIIVQNQHATNNLNIYPPHNVSTPCHFDDLANNAPLVLPPLATVFIQADPVTVPAHHYQSLMGLSPASALMAANLVGQQSGAGETALTDSTGGSTANATLNDVTATPTQALINANFAKIAVLVNKLRADLVALALIKGSA